MRAFKKIYWVIAVVALCIVSVCNSCKRFGPGCGLSMTAFNPYILLQLQNSQGQDLLDPATANHYDTAMIKKANTGLVVMSIQTTGIAKSPIQIWVDYTKAGDAYILKLSSTVQDTLKISSQAVKGDCNTTYTFGLVYNNKTVAPYIADPRLFIITK